MKDKKGNKSNWLDGKNKKGKVSTREAIAQALAPKLPKYIKPLGKLPNISKSLNNSNNLPDKKLKPQPETVAQPAQPIDNFNESEKVYINIVYNSNDSSKLKDILTDRELRFISNYLVGGNSMIQSMILAGYVEYSEAYLYRLGRNLVQRYESQAQDHRIIFRAMGAGEVFVANGLIELAKTSRSDMVRLNAYTQIAKILGLTKEQLEGAGGVTIIFEGHGQPGTTASLPGAPPLPPSQGEIKALPTSTKPIMITK